MTQPINLAEAAKIEVWRIWQLIANYTYMSGDQRWHTGPVHEPIIDSYPDATTAIYRLPDNEVERIKLSNIKVTDLGDVQWDERSESRTRVEEATVTTKTVSDPPSQHTSRYTWGNVKSLRETSKTGFESAVEVSLGANAPVSAKLSQKVDLAFEKEFGETRSQESEQVEVFQETRAGTYRYTAERSVSVAHRVTRSRVKLDYEITLGRYYINNGFQECYLPSKSVFLSWIKGLAPDNVGVMHSGGDTRGFAGEWIPSRNPDVNFAAILRAHPQPDAQLTETDAVVEWMSADEVVVDRKLKQEYLGVA